MKVIQLPRFEQEIHVGLFADVTNGARVREQLLNGNCDFEVAFINASMVLSELHLRAGVHHALAAASEGRMSTKNVHTEIVYALFPGPNIGEALRRFGVVQDTQNLLAIKVGAWNESGRDAVLRAIGGREIPFNDETLGNIRNDQAIRKIYNVRSMEASKLPMACISAMALKVLA